MNRLGKFRKILDRGSDESVHGSSSLHPEPRSGPFALRRCACRGQLTWDEYQGTCLICSAYPDAEHRKLGKHEAPLGRHEVRST